MLKVIVIFPPFFKIYYFSMNNNGIKKCVSMDFSSIATFSLIFIG